MVDIAFLGAQRTARLDAPGVGRLVGTTRGTDEALARGAAVSVSWFDDDAWAVARGAGDGSAGDGSAGAREAPRSIG